jgi:Protein of unknown function (DUF3320)
MCVPSSGLEAALLLLLGRSLGLGCLEQVKVPAVLVVEASGHPAPQLQPIHPELLAAVDPLPYWIDPSNFNSRFDMCPGIEQIAAVEGPVHLEVLLQRLRDSWNIGRVGPRIRANIQSAIDLADVVQDGNFITAPDRDGVLVRTPVAACARSVEQVADTELATALLQLVQASAGVTHDDLTTAVARLYGWNRRGPDISTRLNHLVSDLAAAGRLASTDHGFAPPVQGAD